MEKNKINVNKTDNRDMVVEIFKDKKSADKAIAAVESHGYTRDEISIITSEATRDKYFKGTNEPVDVGSSALKGAGAGSAIGLTLGAIIGGVIAVGSVVIPGVGLIVAGPLAAALAGAGAGSVAGGLIGALAGWGIPDAHVKKYEKAIKEGKIVVGVHPHSDADTKVIKEAWAAFKEEPAYTS